jgi:hypothetical protein
MPAQRARVEGRARVVDDRGIDALLEHKYGWQKRLVDRLNRRSGAAAFAAIEIVDV